MQLEVLVKIPEVSALLQGDLAFTSWYETSQCCEVVNFPRPCGEGGVGREILTGCTQPFVHSSNWKHGINCSSLNTFCILYSNSSGVRGI